MSKKVIFVADAFSEDTNGGAELTTDAIISGSPHLIEKIRCSQINKEIIEKNKNSFWIFGNFSSLEEKNKIYFIKNENYSVIEYDYKYCRYRSDDLHKLVEKECSCEKDLVGKVNSVFLSKSKFIWWMSEGQKKHYITKFPFLVKTNNKVLSSIFNEKTIKNLLSLANNPKNNRWMIMNSPSWIKNVQGCKDYAKKNNLSYDLIWGLSYGDMLKKMSSYKGLIFLPSGKDTCPRLAIEAKLLGCELVLNDNVQHRHEEWFKDKDSIVAYLAEQKKVFWGEIGKHV